MPIGALRLINPPGHRFRRPAPGYVGAYRRPYPQYNPWSSQRDPLGVGASLRVDRKRRAKKKTASPSVRRNPVIKRRKKVAKRTTPPRYTSGPKKGKFMSKRAVAAKRARAKVKRNTSVKRNSPPGKTKSLARVRAAKRAWNRRRLAAKKTVTTNPKKKRKARRRATTSTRSNPMAVRRRRRRVRRNWQLRRPAGQSGPVRELTPRQKAARKAARTRKRNKAARSLAAKKAARKRHAGVSQRPRKRKTKRSKRAYKATHRKPKYGTKAYFRWIGAKGGRKAARKKHRKVAASRPRRKAVRRRRRTIYVGGPGASKRMAFRKRKGGPVYRRRVVVGRHKNRKGRRVMGLHVRRNPGMADFKNILLTGAGVFAGVMGMRLLSNAFRIHLLPRLYTPTATTSATTTKLLGLLPAGVAFLAAAFAGKFIQNAKVVSAVQVGATISLLDAVYTSFVKPSIPVTAQPYLQGVDDMGIQGYGRFSGYGRVGEYLPQRAQPLQGYGLDVHEAMALDEYIPSQGAYGMQVEEALAGSEVEGIQRGYAAGSLARTSLSS